MQKTKFVVVNKAGKFEAHITGIQSWSSCRKVVSGQVFIYFWFSYIAYKAKAQCALAMRYNGHLLEPEHGASAVWVQWSTPSRLYFALNRALNFVGK